MLSLWLPRLLLCLAIPFAARKGDEPERLAAIVLLATFLLDAVNHLVFGDPAWFEVNPGHFVIDLWAFITLTWVALHANRAWPLWVSALQAIVVVGHFAKLFEIDVARISYWAMTQLPYWVQLLILIGGTWTHAEREQRIGRYRSWRSAPATNRTA